MDVTCVTSPPSNGETKETLGPLAPPTGRTETLMLEFTALLPAINCRTYNPGVSAWNVVTREVPLPNVTFAPAGKLNTRQLVDSPVIGWPATVTVPEIAICVLTIPCAVAGVVTTGTAAVMFVKDVVVYCPSDALKENT